MLLLCFLPLHHVLLGLSCEDRRKALLFPKILYLLVDILVHTFEENLLEVPHSVCVSHVRCDFLCECMGNNVSNRR